MRTSTVLSSLALAFMGGQVMATPPACLLACVAEVTKSAGQCSALNQIGCICSKESDNIHSCLNSKCPNGNADEAWNDFQSTCKGKRVDPSSSASSKTSSSKASTSKASPSKASSPKESSPKASPSKASSPKESSPKASPSKASSSPKASSKASPALKSSPSTVTDSAALGKEVSSVASSVDVVTRYFTVVDDITRDHTATHTAAPVTVTIHGGTTYETDCSTTALNGTTFTLQGSTKTLEGSTKTLQGSTITLQGSTKTLQESTKTFQGSTKTLQGSTKTFQGPTKTLQGSTKTFQGPTTTLQGSTKTFQGPTTTLHKRDAQTSTTRTVSSSGGANGLQLGSGLAMLAAAAAFLI